MYPRIVIDLSKLKHNADTLCKMAEKQCIADLAFVTKVFCADKMMVCTLSDSSCRYLADSRIENLAKYPKTDKQRILLRLPMISQADDVVRYSDISFNSERDTLNALSDAAKRQGTQHKVVLMIDMGDLREGVFYRETEKIYSLAKEIESNPNLILYGTAFNLTCYGSVLPTRENLTEFLQITNAIENQIGRKLDFISGGNSSSIPLLLLGQEDLPFNNLRLGEALVLGRETAYGQAIDGLCQDIFTLEAEIVEIQDKPSYPIGQIGMNAFGEKAEYTDLGIRRRAIAAIGRQDMDCEGIAPLLPGVTVVGASSDHLILDITDCSAQLKVHDTVQFRMDYSALLRGFTGGYIHKDYTNIGL